MFMFNNQPSCPWGGNFNGNRPMMMNGPPPFPVGGPRPPLPYHMLPQNSRNWQGPGPSRMRGRGFRRGRGFFHHQGNAQIVNQNSIQDNVLTPRDQCCQCGERLQNSGEPGIHLCDGGSEIHIEMPATSSIREPELKEEEDDLESRLEKLLENMKDFVRTKYDTVTEALEGYVSDKIGEITTLHRENSETKLALEKLKTELEEKAAMLLKQEKEVKERQRKLAKDQDSFKRDMKKEREEICRQWQQLRDEITRMEETHKIQKGRVKLDVGGHVFTTSLLTLTREADSMLAAMFSGRHELLKEEDGCVFIDRDGTHFRYVLNYLRDGGLNMDCLPRDRQLLKELKKEATYYQLHGLLQQIEKYLY
ncbi:uncharacterized protein LOC127861643 isoform X1 [Dreissena polymorpha]|uniref:BTB domain-containing protein n=1 Tax=Dreissena polymorpha TaxID=45954 RepID=A0A9D3Y7M7_DREPO|nr:uncharacterized protein LOC127861643 isoform X1 [Dreissena polymorpha]XP_052256282.1 uncharacterized protein LOC127861643 isoform X1 [Dreissena polymorpha]KAH3694186.1 hypothetical protein DPMN_081625 [Dreissena polymorpha]